MKIAAGAALAVLTGLGFVAQRTDDRAAPPPAANADRPHRQNGIDAELAERLRTLSERADGSVGVAVIHVETGRTAGVRETLRLPLYSVFKLPVAISVLEGVEANRLRLDQKVGVTPEEVLPGWRPNTDLWGRPVERSVAELLELSLARSDNTSSDKLLQLVGGPEVVTRRMRELGLQNTDIRSSVRDFTGNRGEHPNTGTASDFAQLLARLRKGEVLQPPQLDVLLTLMGRAMTGLQRLRGDLPAGTPVADKTGTGGAGSATNDVGLITLPDGKGHLAIAVLVSGSKLPERAQEKLIAQLARAAYDAYVHGGSK